MRVLALFPLVTALIAACGEPPATPAGVPPPPPPPPPPPDVLVIVMDTTRADRCSFLGYERPTTPHLAAFAAESVVYRNAWTPAGWTGPAHASLFTGLRPAHHGFLHPTGIVLSDRATTLAELLGAAGYRTALYSNSPVVSAGYGLTQGYVEAPNLLMRTDRVLPLCRETHDLALTMLRRSRRDGVPVHVFVNDFEPHLSYTPPEDVQARFVGPRAPADLLAAARTWQNPAVVEQTLGVRATDPGVLALAPELYDAEIAGVDEEIGTFLDSLRAEGLLSRMLVVIAGDHGENLGEHGLWDHHFGLYATVRHVPLLIHFPEGKRGGTVVDDVVRLEDVLPTVLEVCGQPIPAGLDGASLLGDLDGRVARASYGFQPRIRERFREEHPGQDPPILSWSFRAVLDGTLHLIERSDGHVELYDEATDPAEADDLAPTRPAEVRRLGALLDPWSKSSQLGRTR